MANYSKLRGGPNDLVTAIRIAKRIANRLSLELDFASLEFGQSGPGDPNIVLVRKVFGTA